MSLTPDLDEYRANEGLYEDVGADRGRLVGSSVDRDAAGRAVAHAAPDASSCSHEVRDLLAICRGCQTALVIEEDWRG